ncbi:restriction endonuclease [Pseudomonas sp. Pdm06]|uniref:restriction endonuclease n=1 Tax=Pseudomonas sp. Pdm06 TaxID=1790044 RepID=UPI001780372C|nr:restriction endonuclease [Pseudomonas sp. Pdm06]MBD9463925.1 restriction endonuclease [Pseudomonas sp. Pdm06]
MAHLFYGKSAPKSIEYVNSDVFLKFLANMTNDFADIQDAQFNKWNHLRFVDVTDTYANLKSSIQELCDNSPVPASITSYFSDENSELTLEQRFELYTKLNAHEEQLNPLLNFVDPAGYKWHKEYFESFEAGVRTATVLGGMTRLSAQFYAEVNNFKVALDSIIPNRDAIIKVFTSQNIRYATGELNFDKIFKVLKSQFGDAWKGYVAYKGVLIEYLLDSTGTTVLAKPSPSTTGLSLEKAVLELYQIIGYTVSETSVSGDFGIDILAQSNTEKIGIQCKNYAGNVGVDSVMQAHSGGHYYGCSRFVVYSSNGFTSAAHEMAKKLNVELLIYKGALG